MTEAGHVEVRFGGWGATFRDFDEEDHILRQMRSSHQFYESDLLGWMFHNSKPGSYVIDVGACIGTFAVFCAKVLKAGVLAIEPDERNFQEADFNIRQNGVADKVALLKAALGAAKGTGTIQHAVDHNCGAKSVVLTSRPDDVNANQVQVIRLDDASIDRKVTCIKIDTEGAELSVLRGATKVIRRWRPVIIVECANDSQYHELENFLGILGYHFHRRFCATPTYIFLPHSWFPGRGLLYKLQMLGKR